MLYIVIALLVFGLLIFVHEGGHFLAARACGVRVLEFSIGMGPQLIAWQSKKSKTKYSIRLFPVGGFCSMLGEAGTESDLAREEADRVKEYDDNNSMLAEDAIERMSNQNKLNESEVHEMTAEEREDYEKHSFEKKNVWQRLIITAAGAITNIIIGFIITAILVLMTENLGSTVIGKFVDGATSNGENGLMVDDKIVKIGNTSVATWNELLYEIIHVGHEPVDVTVIRKGEKKVIENVNFPKEFDQTAGVEFGEPDFIPYGEEKNFGNIMKHTFRRSVSTIKMVWDSLVDLLTGRYGLNALSGPVGVTEGISNAAKSGIDTFLYLVSIISMNLGVFNLIPIPALDGGRIFFMIIEIIRGGKKLDPKIEGIIHSAGLMLLFLLMIIISVKDVVGLIFR